MSEGGENKAPELPGALTTVRRLDGHLQKAEVAVCLGSLAVMIGLAFTQVFLRFVQGTFEFMPEPVAWFDNVARHLVIWVGVLGASLATAEGRHISIEALPKILSDAGKRRVEALVCLVSLAITGILLVLCVIYMHKLQLHESGELFIIPSLGGLKVPRWPFLTIVPVGLAIMAWRFGLRATTALILDDETFTELREREEAKEMDDVDTVQEPQEVGLLLDTARRTAEESGTQLELTEESARSEVREVLRSDRFKAQDIKAAAEKARQEKQGRKQVFKSTDEIPTYTPVDLHGDEDKGDPVMMEGVPIDSDDELEISGVADVVIESEDVEDAVEAAAESAREIDPSEETSAIDPEAKVETTRIPIESDDGEAGETPEDPDVTQRVQVDLPEESKKVVPPLQGLSDRAAAASEEEHALPEQPEDEETEEAEAEETAEAEAEETAEAKAAEAGPEGGAETEAPEPGPEDDAEREAAEPAAEDGDEESP